MDQPRTDEPGNAAGEDEAGRLALASTQALRAGAHAPDFALLDQDGHLVSLTEKLENGPAVLSFLDGRADPDVQLLALTDCAAQIREHGGSLLAISPIARLRAGGTGAVRILHDAGSVVAGRYGLCRRAEADSAPATFVIARCATIIMSLIDAAPARDLSRANVVSALSALRRIEGRRP